MVHPEGGREAAVLKDARRSSSTCQFPDSLKGRGLFVGRAELVEQSQRLVRTEKWTPAFRRDDRAAQTAHGWFAGARVLIGCNEALLDT